MSTQTLFPSHDLQDFRTLSLIRGADAHQQWMDAHQQWLDDLSALARFPDHQQTLFDHIEQLVEMVKNPDDLPQGMFTQMQTYLHIADVLKDANVGLDQAAVFAQRSLDLFLAHGQEGHISYKHGNTHFHVLPYKLHLYSTLSQLQYRLGETEWALSLINECVEAIAHYFSSFDVLPHGTATLQKILLECGVVYQATGQTEKAEQVYRDAYCVSGGKNTEALQRWEQGYLQQHHTSEGFRSLVAESLAAALERYKQGILANRVEERKPDFALNDLSGKPVRLAALRGKVVVLGFGFHCGFCQVKLPFYAQAAARYQGDERVAFLWVSDADASVSELVQYMDTHRYTFTMLRDTRSVHDQTTGFGEVFQVYGIQGIPQLFVLDQEGTIRFKEYGHLHHESACEIDYAEALSWKIDALLQ